MTFIADFLINNLLCDINMATWKFRQQITVSNWIFLTILSLQYTCSVTDQNSKLIRDLTCIFCYKPVTFLIQYMYIPVAQVTQYMYMYIPIFLVLTVCVHTTYLFSQFTQYMCILHNLFFQFTQYTCIQHTYFTSLYSTCTYYIPVFLVQTVHVHVHTCFSSFYSMCSYLFSQFTHIPIFLVYTVHVHTT